MQIVGDKINEYYRESGRNYKSKKLINIKKNKKVFKCIFYENMICIA